MKNHALLVLNKDCEKEVDDYSRCEIAFLNTGTTLSLDWLQGHPRLLDHLKHQITRKPDGLLPHIQRIYYCFQKRLSEQLYAALLDFFIVLEERGETLRMRMFHGSKSRLSKQQGEYLMAYLHSGKVLPGNSFSILHSGCTGNPEFITMTERPADKQHDPLQLARDFIDYSQLTEAKEVLEKAILEQPENAALSELLLELYKSTDDYSGWQRIMAFFSERQDAVPAIWTASITSFAADHADAQ